MFERAAQGDVQGMLIVIEGAGAIDVRTLSEAARSLGRSVASAADIRTRFGA